VTRLIAPILILIVAGCVAGTAAAADPPLGAYQEPAPRPVPEQNAVGFVNELLERQGGVQRVSRDDLRKGVVVQAERTKPKGPKKAGSLSEAPTAVAARRLDSGPAERAGVASPVDADQPGMLVGLVVAGLLGALGLALWLADSRKKA
jgi:hypothetical protein